MQILSFKQNCLCPKYKCSNKKYKQKLLTYSLNTELKKNLTVIFSIWSVLTKFLIKSTRTYYNKGVIHVSSFLDYFFLHWNKCLNRLCLTFHSTLKISTVCLKKMLSISNSTLKSTCIDKSIIMWFVKIW